LNFRSGWPLFIRARSRGQLQIKQAGEQASKQASQPARAFVAGRDDGRTVDPRTKTAV